jgi:pseudouridylate synthase
VLDGVPRIGLSQTELDRLLTKENVSKVSARDLAWAMETRANGATTVASTLALACLGGIKYFATGGIGGVHREPAFDESADLLELSRSQVLVVCSGAKSILDLPATMERLESLGVSIIGYRTTEMPGFFTTGTGMRLASCTSSLLQVVGAWRNHLRLRRPGALLVVQPPPASLALDAGEVNTLVERSYDQARKEGIRGAAVTPYLLSAIAKETGGRSLAVNIALLEQNAALAGQLAAAVAMTGPAIE